MLRIGRGMARLVLVAAVAWGVSGCIFAVGAAAGGAAYAYLKGEGTRAYAEPLPKVRDAVLKALEDLSLPRLHADTDGVSSKIKSTTSDGRDINVVLTSESAKVTMVSVRVGMFGDEVITRRLIARIDARVGG